MWIAARAGQIGGMKRTIAHEPIPLSTEGEVHLVALNTAERRPHFSTWQTASLMAGYLAAPEAWERTQLLAWVLMPDRWQGLIRLGGHEYLSKCLSRLKRDSTRRFHKAHPGLAPDVWARGYQDRLLNEGTDLRAVARELAMSPVRAGLAARIADYPYWDAVWI